MCSASILLLGKAFTLRYAGRRFCVNAIAHKKPYFMLLQLEGVRFFLVARWVWKLQSGSIPCVQTETARCKNAAAAHTAEAKYSQINSSLCRNALQLFFCGRRGKLHLQSNEVSCKLKCVYREKGGGRGQNLQSGYIRNLGASWAKKRKHNCSLQSFTAAPLQNWEQGRAFRN